MELQPSILHLLFVGIPALVRLTALAFTLPLISSRNVPVRLRVAFSVVLACLVVPMLVLHSAHDAPVFDLRWVTSLIHEALIGASMGLAAQVLLAAASVTGSTIESLCGLTFGLPDDSAQQENGSVLARLFWWTAVAVFIAAGGANAMTSGVIDSFQIWPPGTASYDQGMLEFFGMALGNCFEFGLRAAIPGLAALMVAAAVLGIAQRNCPQLGGMQVGLGLKAICGLLVTSLLLLSTPWLVNNGFEDSWSQIQEFVFQDRG